MSHWLGRSRYLVAVIALGVGLLALVTTIWAWVKALHFVDKLLDDGGWRTDGMTGVLLESVDLFLVATTLFVVAVGLWELFVADIDLPGWLSVETLNDLKVKVADLLVLVLAVKYLERFTNDRLDSQRLMEEAIAVVLVGGLLVAFAAIRSKREPKGTAVVEDEARPGQ